MSLDVSTVGGAVLLVSQFTLYGDMRRGRRPSFDRAMEPVTAEALPQRRVGELIRARGVVVETGGVPGGDAGGERQRGAGDHPRRQRPGVLKGAFRGCSAM